MARNKRSIRAALRLERICQVAFGGAIGLGGLMWAYSLMHLAGLQVSADGFGVSRLISLVSHWS